MLRWGALPWSLLVLVTLSALPAFAKDKPLDFRQRMDLKDATYYLDQVEGMVAAMEEIAAPWKEGDASVPANDVKRVLDTRTKCTQYLKNTKTRLDKLPAEHEDVAPQVKRHDELTKELAVVEKNAVAIDKGLKGIADQGGGTAAFAKDFDRLKEINLTLSDPTVIQRRPQDAVELVKLVAPLKAERKRINETYADLLKQPTDESRRLREVLARSDDVFGKFEKATADYVAEVPGEIEAEIAKTLKLAQQGVDEQKPAFFGPEGGVTQQFNSIEKYVRLLDAAAPDSAAAKQAAAKLTEARAKSAEMVASLKDGIIEANQVPAESYSGADADADAMRMIVQAKWAKEGTGQPVLKLGISSQNWRRDTRWEWSSASKAFEKVDKSKAQGFVVVKHDDKHAAVHYVNLSKDHLANDQVTAYFRDLPNEEPAPDRLILLKNVK